MELRKACPEGFELMRRVVAANREGPASVTLPLVPFEMIEASAKDGEAKLPRFSMTAYTGTAMNLGWGESVVIDLAGMETPSEGDQFPIFLSHDADRIVGHADTWAITERRLKVDGPISGTGDAAREVVGNAKNGFRWKASVGASVGQVEFVDGDQTVKVNGQNFKGPIYVARKTVLMEVSFVPIGADNRTSTRVAATAMKPTQEELQAKFKAWELNAKFADWQKEKGIET